MSKTIESGCNPTRFLGVTYSATMHALKDRDPRAMLTLHLVFVVVWLRLPWRHVSPKELGATSASWGFCLSLTRRYWRISWGD